jgi:Domain of unknown function (DUF4202)
MASARGQHLLPAMQLDASPKQRLARVLAAIDGVNAKDPVPAKLAGAAVPRALLYGRRMSAMLEQLAPEASDLLRIAARAQHIERWIMPRNSYPEGRIAYLQWRKDLQHHHARRTAEIMREAGYGQAGIDRVGSLLRKEGLKTDAETQLLEDVVCLVFLQHEAAEFIAGHDDEKVIGILAKTVKKMSERGLEAAAKLSLEERLSRLLAKALRAQPA